MRGRSRIDEQDEEEVTEVGATQEAPQSDEAMAVLSKVTEEEKEAIKKTEGRPWHSKKKEAPPQAAVPPAAGEDAQEGPTIDALRDGFERLEIDRNAVFRILNHQISRAASDIKELGTRFDDSYANENYPEAAASAVRLIDLLYSIYEKQMHLIRACLKTITKMKELLAEREGAAPGAPMAGDE